MNSKARKVTTIALMLALVPTIANSKQSLGPDGHYYEVVVLADITWGDAKTAATTANHLGISGHLATIKSDAVNAFVESIRQPILGDYPGKSEAWIGGSQPSGSGNNVGWTWVNGEGAIGGGPGPSALPYANWQCCNEPNNAGVEDQITLGRYGDDGTWNDSKVGHGNIGGYIVEYDTVPPIANDDPLNPANSGETINIDVLANDLLHGQTVTSVNVTSPPASGGAAMVVACVPATSAFCVDYQSAPAFGGDDTFTYTVNSGGLVSNIATVTVQVDGSVSVTPAGPDIPVFGGTNAGVPLAATGEVAENSEESSLMCDCRVRDDRVIIKTRHGRKKIWHRWRSFDLGAAIKNPLLASSGCLDLPDLGPHKLVIPPYFSVHTDPAIAKADLVLEDFEFGVCKVDTGVQWSGPIHLDVNAQDVAGYEVDCKIPSGGVGKQPLTLGLTTFLEEFTAPFMRPVSIECDPRSVARWSTWYFTPNATHLPRLWPSRFYVHTYFYVLRSMMTAMDVANAVDDVLLLNDVRSLVSVAEGFLHRWRIRPADAINTMIALDDATVLVLTPDPIAPVYPGGGMFPNPKGQLASHIMSLRYAVCSELAYPNDLAMCRVRADVEALLPPLP